MKRNSQNQKGQNKRKDKDLTLIFTKNWALWLSGGGGLGEKGKLCRRR